MQCELCNQEAGDGAQQNVAGLKVCSGCYNDTYLPTRLSARGFHLGFWYRDKNGAVLAGTDDYGGGKHTLTALAEAQNVSEIHTKLSYEGISAKMQKIFKHEIQIGDKAFDDLVYIQTATQKATGDFLSISGVQAAVSELIEMKAEIDIDGNKIYLKAENDGDIEVRMFLLYAAVLLHYLDEFAKQSN